MRYGTAVSVDGDRAQVVTKPRDGSTYVYPFRRVGDAWVIVRDRDWYTRHALKWARDHLDARVISRQVPDSQTFLAKFIDGGNDERGGGVEAADVGVCAD